MAPFEWFEAPWGPSLVCRALSPWAHHVFTAHGLDVSHPDRGDGWATLAEWFDVPPSHVWRLRQVHGVCVFTDEPDARGGDWPEGDLLATDRTDVALAVRTADCVPVLLADRRTGIVAAVHAGWRGAVADAVGRMVEVMGERFGSSPRDLVAAIGPCAGPEAYEVGEDVVQAFRTAYPHEDTRPRWWRTAPQHGKYLLDLWTITRDQLLAAGVDAADVHLAGLCTVTHADRLHSFRVQGARAGRMASVVMRRRP